MEMRRIRWVGDIRPLVRAITEQSDGFVLESSLRANGLGRFTFAGFGSLSEFTYEVEDFQKGERAPLHALEEWFQQFCTDVVPERFPFTGGAVGFLAYEAAVGWMPKLESLKTDLRIPLIEFKAYDGIFAYDNEDGSLHVLAHGWNEPSSVILARLEAFAKGASGDRSDEAAQVLEFGEVTSNFTSEAYRNAVEKARDYIREGEVYQVNLAQCFQVPVAGVSAPEIYARLRSNTRAPYSAYLPVKGGHLLSSSPEQLLCRTGRRLTSRPIKGTRPRGSSIKSDEAQRQSLSNSEKDQAELLMIVDLVRNDLGRIAECGTVEVDGLFNLETYPSVIHQTARVSALANEGVGLADSIEALFPGGSITGAPKLRAMQIVSELENQPRGAYTGAIGWIDPSGNFELNIAIRTATLVDETLSYHAGAGIVWDSVAELEYAETLDKVAGFFSALGLSFPLSSNDLE